MNLTIQQTIDELRQALTDYIEATYHIAHPGIVAQRRRLLDEIGGIFQAPYLESTPRYTLAKRYEEATDIPKPARDAFTALGKPVSGRSVIFDPPYTHQADAIREVLSNRRNLMIMTGTGSGKTESFLLPILGKLIIEATTKPDAFHRDSAIRAMVLYPMNALVNDQLGRLRLLFGDPRVIALFEKLAGRPARFARYTSRTPYAGVRSPKKDSDRLASIGAFFGAIEDAAERHQSGHPNIATEDERAADLQRKLHRKGKWPAKESVSAWFGRPHVQWRDRNGSFQRAVLGEHDAELLTRHEVQAAPPDLLITNYSMLEYMMMRPIERPIFDRTREWLEKFPDERFLVVLDEAHLYRGAQGAEVGLLLRRLRERLNIGPDRFQVICATASFSDEGKANAGDFGAQLSGTPAASFVPISGSLADRSPNGPGTPADARALAAIDLDAFYSSDPATQIAGLRPFLDYRGVRPEGEDVGPLLHAALSAFPPFNHLVNATMRSAIPVDRLGELAFPGAAEKDVALNAMLALGSRARLRPDDPSLLPCRVHSFFRGLPGLWACMDPDCNALAPYERGGPTGRIYSQRLERCSCGAPVLEYFTCRYCGVSYARAYTDNINTPRLIWPDAGDRLQTDAGLFEAHQPIDLLLESPSREEWGREAYYDLRTGLLNPAHDAEPRRIVYLRPDDGGFDEEADARRGAQPGEYAPCGCCGRQFMFGQSSVQDHQTKGDNPFQAVLATQIRVQPPGPQPATEFAPLRGRKVLVFSDSRQMAARLAPTLQAFSLKDTIRALVPAGFRILAADPQFGSSVVLDHAFLAVVVAAHRFGVRVRPELDTGEVMPRIDAVPIGQVPTGPELIRLMSAPCPANLMKAMTEILADKSLGLEPLAVASIAESQRLTPRIASLPNLPGLAEDEADKLDLARAWLRCWLRGPGIWFGSMPPNWWTNQVRTHKGGFADMDRVLIPRGAKKAFTTVWLPRLLADFTQRSQDGGTRLLASNLALDIGGDWRRCPTCKSTHRPITRLVTCIDCGAPGVEAFDPDADPVFRARRGFYRDPVIQALTAQRPTLMSLIAAEHTAQLNAAQREDAFSQAENHEMRFQDIDLSWRDTDPPDSAIDVLSSTTTMEVGIDIGELSGVALRNMPPARANYQQRAGRAGRRGSAVATVVAFGGADSHDDHYFRSPDEMIRGPVADPRLTLENPDIARRHVRAFLLQRYHEDRIPALDPDADPSLFSVLGSVREFREGTGVLNRADFATWLEHNRNELEAALDRWLPLQLSPSDRSGLIEDMMQDVLQAVDMAVGATGQDEPDANVEAAAPEPEDTESTEEPEPPEDTDFVDPARDKLLDRLLYWGVLPRYAFPTDVAPFYVFNRALSTPFRPRMEFAPSQGLNIALSQYAPNKQIWIKGKQYTSKAIYSPYRNERRDAWGRRKLYFECSRCGHAKTDPYDDARRNVVLQCEACRAPGTFGPSKRWFRPPGFAHPIDRDPVSTPDAPIETAYATRAKLVMPEPVAEEDWLHVDERIRALATRQHLLVSNSGPEGEGYHYCVACGRIESVADPETNLFQPHTRPFPSDEPEPCPGRVADHIVLGTDFRTDVALFSFRLDAPFRLRPGNDETMSALRTLCEAMAKAACHMLQIEQGEILAEFRPALTDAGATGLEAEIFLYDTLAGGAGFSTQIVPRSAELFERSLLILEECPADCDASCYRCLRSFRNKLDHVHLDRQLGEQVLRHAISGGYPPYSARRIRASLDLLADDLQRQLSASCGVHRSVERNGHLIPIIVTNRASGRETWIALASPIAPGVPTDPSLQSTSRQFVCVDDLLVRRNLPAAIEQIASSL